MVFEQIEIWVKPSSGVESKHLFSQDASIVESPGPGVNAYYRFPNENNISPGVPGAMYILDFNNPYLSYINASLIEEIWIMVAARSQSLITRGASQYITGMPSVEPSPLRVTVHNIVQGGAELLNNTPQGDPLAVQLLSFEIVSVGAAMYSRSRYTVQGLVNNKRFWFQTENDLMSIPYFELLFNP